MTFELGPDIEIDRQEVKHTVKNQIFFGKLLFNPDDLKKPTEPLKINDFQMP